VSQVRNWLWPDTWKARTISLTGLFVGRYQDDFGAEWAQAKVMKLYRLECVVRMEGSFAL